MNKEYIYWDRIPFHMQDMTSKIFSCEKGKQFTEDIRYKTKQHIIVGILTGGIIPAVLLKDYISAKMILSLGVTSYEDGLKTKDLFVYQDLPTDMHNVMAFLVDDVSETGDTMLFALEHLRERHCHDILTCSLHCKEGSKYKPDVYLEEVPDDKWIVYPWEEKMLLESWVNLGKSCE